MNVLAKPPMTVEKYLAWGEGRTGRYELFRGEVFAMSPETVEHVEAKGNIFSALRTAVHNRCLPCHVLMDGPTVRIDDDTAYEPDALVYCGDKLPKTHLEVPNPVIIVEVLSPATRRIDVSVKLSGYFRLPSVAHYLIVDLTQRTVVHHARSTGEDILTHIVRDGVISLDPPGLMLAVNDIFSE